MSGKAQPHDGQMKIVSAADHLAEERHALTDRLPRPEEGAYTPPPSPQDRFQVLLYSVVHGDYIHDSYHRLLEVAKAKRSSLAAVGHKAKIVKFNHSTPGPATAPLQPMTRLLPKPPLEDPYILGLQKELRELWARVGRDHWAVPCSHDKLLQCIKAAQADLDVKS